MGIAYGLQQVRDCDLEKFLHDPERLERFFESGTQLMIENHKKQGFFARLFGFQKAAISTPRCAQSEFDHSGALCDIGKAWHGLHFLLSGSTWEGEFPSGFLLNGGVELGDVDSEPSRPRSYNSAEVQEINNFLTGLSAEDFGQRYDPLKMDALDIYPKFWVRDGSKGLDYLLTHFKNVKVFFADSAEKRLGVMITSG